MSKLDIFKDYLTAEELASISGGAKSIKDAVVDHDTHCRRLVQYLVNAAKCRGETKEQFLRDMASRELTEEANGITYPELEKLTNVYW